MVDRLLSAGANTSISASRGGTALQIARHKRHTVIAERIAQLGSNPGDRELVREVQTLLKLRGFYTGPVDGDYGKKTEAAADSFRWAANISGRGPIDDRLLEELRSNVDRSEPIGALWGAVAIHRKSANGYGSWRKETSEAAEEQAMQQCKAKHSNCEAGPYFYDGCYVMARRGNGWGHAVAENIDLARRKALDECKNYNPAGCYVSWGFCSDGSFDLVKFR
jgi:peptidoglycan hydrolase-like protein with peptidoglycan-binding domain